MQMHIKIKIDAPAGAAWKVIGEGFGNISEWASSLKSSSLEGGLKVGGVRTCEDSNGFGPFKPGMVKERLVTYDASTMTLEYVAIAGIPGFIKRVSNRWSVHAVNEQHCIVYSDVAMQFRGVARLFGPVIGPLMKMAVKSDLDKFTEELRYRVVNGRPQPDAKR